MFLSIIFVEVHLVRCGAALDIYELRGVCSTQNRRLPTCTQFFVRRSPYAEYPFTVRMYADYPDPHQYLYHHSSLLIEFKFKLQKYAVVIATTVVRIVTGFI